MRDVLVTSKTPSNNRMPEAQRFIKFFQSISSEIKKSSLLWSDKI